MQIRTGVERKAGLSTSMRLFCLAATDIRRTLVDRDDVPNVVGFQNDINILLSLLEEPHIAWSTRAEPWFPGTRVG